MQWVRVRGRLTTLLRNDLVHAEDDIEREKRERRAFDPVDYYKHPVMIVYNDHRYYGTYEF